MFKKTPTKGHFSVSEVAKILHISREAVLKKITKHHLKAEKVGRNYIISKENLGTLLGTTISQEQQREIEKVVKRAVKEYGVTFRRLGEEK